MVGMGEEGESSGGASSPSLVARDRAEGMEGWDLDPHGNESRLRSHVPGCRGSLEVFGELFVAAFPRGG